MENEKMTEKQKKRLKEIYKIEQHFGEQLKSRHRMNHLKIRHKMYIAIKYGKNGDIKQIDKFCPLIKEVCLGSVCAFWVDDTIGCKQK